MTLLPAKAKKGITSGMSEIDLSFFFMVTLTLFINFKRFAKWELMLLHGNQMLNIFHIFSNIL